jgi:16S rRNA (cytidine1402-2'-O)-methyltransferase
MLEEGKRIALVSDAGTPGISDPGSRIVHAVRAQLADRIVRGKNETDALAKSAAKDMHVRDIVIEAIPGPSALTTLISISGMDCASFFFAGFSPHKKGRETFFRETCMREVATVFYESPHRLVNALERITALDPSREVCVGRELTKVYEEVRRGPAIECLTWYTAHPPKGECVVIVSGQE